VNENLDEQMDLERRLRETTRWLMLRLLYAGRPTGASELILMHLLNELGWGYTEEDMRRELDYLGSRDLAEVGQDDLVGWWGRLTSHGVAVAEYAAPAPAGIGRPKKFQGRR
jgi:hypothetical protein